MITLMIAIFVIGYIAIATEHSIHVNKAASALLIGVLLWTIYILNADSLVNTGTEAFKSFLAGQGITEINSQVVHHFVEHALLHQLSEVAGILFFLIGAMTIVELVDAHNGFSVITDKIKTNSKVVLLWIIGGLSFFLSAVLDNLTTTIVMVSLLRKLIDNREDRMFYVGIVVIAANAGGAWSPIGDVTTTMLWIGKQITSANIIRTLIIPSIVCLIVPLAYLSLRMKGNFIRPQKAEKHSSGHHHVQVNDKEKMLVFVLGVAGLLFVPIFKTYTHLPPFMGMLFSLGVLWAVTELMHRHKLPEEKEALTAYGVIRKIDTPSILFFLGILVAIGALQSTGVLTSLATWLDTTIGNQNVIVLTIGLLSSIIDNVPLVAAAQGMYSLDVIPTDNPFWEFLAYAAGTGGSALIIGSAAGVAAMGMEKIDFFWYLKKISLLALIGYFAGAIIYIYTHHFFVVESSIVSIT
jgi:Na+/H+ antiporter NhaD/arsenite permease-like protein